MVIKEIKIRHVGAHEDTNIFLGSKATIIFAENGTGKSLFANSFSKNKSWFRGWTDFSGIDFFGKNNSKGRLLYKEDEEELVWDKKTKIQDPIILYDDWIFNDTLKTHYKTNKIYLPSDKKQTQKNRIVRDIHSLKKIRQLNNKFTKLHKPTEKDIIKYHLNRYPHAVAQMGINRKKIYKNYDIEKHAKRILKIYNQAETKTDLFKNSVLSRWERAGLRLFLNFIFKKQGFNENEIWTEMERGSFRITQDDIIYSDKSPKKLSKSHIQKLKNSLLWVSFFSSYRFRKINRPLIRNYIKYDLDVETEKHSNSILDTLNKKLEEELGEIEKEINSDKQKRKKISKRMNKIIRVMPLKGKASINAELEVIKGKSKVSLSSGEIKVLDLILFIEINKDSQKVFLFDDPLTSADNNYIRLLLSYITNELKDKQLVFLTHNENVLNKLRNRYYKNSKDKEENKKIAFYQWKNDIKNGKVISSEFKIHKSAIEIVCEQINNVDLSFAIRIHNARRIFEHMAFVASGNNNLEKIYNKNKEKISWFGKQVACPVELWNLLNDYSHYTLDDFNNIKNETFMETKLNEIISIIENLGFKLEQTTEAKMSNRLKYSK